MANYQLLKADIDTKVYENAYREITGENLNSVLNQMVTTLGAEYQFAGVATTATNPGTPDAKVFYIAKGKGTYTNFGGLEVTEDEVVVLYWDSAWHKVATGIASQAKLSELGSEVDCIEQSVKGLSLMPSYIGWLESSQIVKYGSSQFKVLMVSPGDIVEIYSPLSTQILILSDFAYPAKLPYPITLAEGNTGRITINGIERLKMPTDAKFIAIQWIWHDGVDKGSSIEIKINGVNVIDPESEMVKLKSKSTFIGNTFFSEYGKYYDLEDCQSALYDDNGAWIKNSSDFNGYMIPVNAGEKIYLKASPVGDCLYSLLKSDNLDKPDYCEGNSRTILKQNTHREIVVPDDAQYIWVVRTYSAVDRTPIVHMVGELNKSITDLQNSSSIHNTELNKINTELNKINKYSVLGKDSYNTYKGWIESDGKLVSYGPSKVRIIPISEGDRVEILARTLTVNFAILAEFNDKHSLPYVPTLSSEYSGRIAVLPRQVYVFNATSDCKYVMIQDIHWGGQNIDSEVIINGVNVYRKVAKDTIPASGIEQRDIDMLDSVLTVSRGSNFNFIHTSDTHLHSQNRSCFDAIINLLQNENIDCLVHTGDIVWDNYPNNDKSSEGAEIFVDSVTSQSKDVIICVGNHDVGGEYKNVATSGTDKQIYDTFYAPISKDTFVYGGKDTPYFYVDYADKKIRFISLYQFNTDFELADDNTLKYVRGREAWRQEEINWLCDTLNNTPEGYVIFVLTHVPQSFGEKLNGWQSIKLANKVFDEFLVKIINAFIVRGTVNESVVQNAGVVGTINAVYDFSTAKASFGALLNGHTHDDYIGKVHGYNINVINKCCDNTEYQGNTSVMKNQLTYAAHTINVVSVDTGSRTISIYRVGTKYAARGDRRDCTYLTY